MIALLNILLGLCVIVIVLAVAVVLWLNVRRRTSNRHSQLLYGKYAESLSNAMLSNAMLSPPMTAISVLRMFPYIGSRRSKLLLTELIATMTESTYGYDRYMLERIVAQTGLEDCLMHRVRATRALHRAAYLKLSMRMPLSEQSWHRMARYATDRNPYVSLYALMLSIYHAPDNTIETIEMHPYALNNFELSQISTLLLHLFVPSGIVFPMLDSDKANHLLLGMELVRRFGEQKAGERVIELVSHPDTQVRDAALRTLVVVKSSLDRLEIVAVVAAMSDSQRKSFYRMLVAEGYSLHALRGFVAAEKNRALDRYIARLLSARKRILNKKAQV